MSAAARGKKWHLLSRQIVECMQSFLRPIKAEGGQRGTNFLGRRRGCQQQLHLARYRSVLFESNAEQSLHGVPRISQMPLELCGGRRWIARAQQPRGNSPEQATIIRHLGRRRSEGDL